MGVTYEPGHPYAGTTSGPVCRCPPPAANRSPRLPPLRCPDCSPAGQAARPAARGGPSPAEPAGSSRVCPSTESRTSARSFSRSSGPADPFRPAERGRPAQQVVADTARLQGQPFDHRPVPVEDAGSQLADDHDRVPLLHTGGHVLGQGAEAGHGDPGRLAIHPLAPASDPRRAGQPEAGNRDAAPSDLDLPTHVAGHVYERFHADLLTGRVRRACAPEGRIDRAAANLWTTLKSALLLWITLGAGYHPDPASRRVAGPDGPESGLDACISGEPRPTLPGSHLTQVV